MMDGREEGMGVCYRISRGKHRGESEESKQESKAL